jgi:F0F1-type ATP synthase epsilon subunit
MKKTSTISVSILAPDRVVFEGVCHSITSKNSDGLFDLLPDHARFLTLLNGEPIEIEGVDEHTTFTFTHAVLFFQDNIAKIYIHTA